MKIIFIFAGILKYKGRLLKQLSTLVENGFDCLLIHGRVEKELPDYSKYSFQIKSIRLKRSRNPIKNFSNSIIFNFKAGLLAKKLGADYIVCEELWSSLSGIVFKFLSRNRKFIFDCNELFLDMGMNKFKQLLWQPIHSMAFRKADIIMHAEEQRLQYCKTHYKTKGEHFLLKNLPKFELIDLSSKINKNNPIKVLYLGALLPDRFCEKVIDAFAGIDPDIAVCDFIGFGKPKYEDKLRNRVDRHNLKNVRFLSPVENQKVKETIAAYDIGLAFYQNINWNQYYCAPNKIYEYIVCGVPVITNNYPGLVKTIQDNQIGICIDKIDSLTLYNAIIKIINDHYKLKITKEIKQQFNWSSQEQPYCSLFNK